MDVTGLKDFVSTWNRQAKTVNYATGINTIKDSVNTLKTSMVDTIADNIQVVRSDIKAVQNLALAKTIEPIIAAKQAYDSAGQLITNNINCQFTPNYWAAQNLIGSILYVQGDSIFCNETKCAYNFSTDGFDISNDPEVVQKLLASMVKDPLNVQCPLNATNPLFAPNQPMGCDPNFNNGIGSEACYIPPYNIPGPVDGSGDSINLPNPVNTNEPDVTSNTGSQVTLTSGNGDNNTNFPNPPNKGQENEPITLDVNSTNNCPNNIILDNPVCSSAINIVVNVTNDNVIDSAKEQNGQQQPINITNIIDIPSQEKGQQPELVDLQDNNQVVDIGDKSETVCQHIDDSRWQLSYCGIGTFVEVAFESEIPTTIPLKKSQYQVLLDNNLAKLNMVYTKLE